METIIDRGRGPEIAGTRITVYDILDYTSIGWHHTAIAAMFRISSRQVQAAMQYIEEHKEEVMAHYQEILERSGRGNPPAIQAKADAAHAKFVARLNERQLAALREIENACDSDGP